MFQFQFVCKCFLPTCALEQRNRTICCQCHDLQIKNCRIVTIRQAMKHGNCFPRKESAVLFKLCSRHLSLRSLTEVKIKLRPINEIKDAVTTIQALFNSDTFRGIKEDYFTSHPIILRKKGAVSIGSDALRAIIAVQT